MIRNSDYKLIAVDLDGTLLNSNKEVSEVNRKAMLDIQHRGIKVAIASGRPPIGCKAAAENIGLSENNGYVIGYNGGEIIEYSSKRCIFDKSLPTETIKDIWTYAETNGFTLLIHDDVIITNNKDNQYVQLSSVRNRMEILEIHEYGDQLCSRRLHKCMIADEPSVIKNIAGCTAEMFPTINVFQSEPHFLEFVPKGIDKGEALRMLAQHINISMEDVIAFGDALNDIPMLSVAGTGVAMGNAPDKLKELADIIAPANDEDGVAWVING